MILIEKNAHTFQAYWSTGMAASSQDEEERRLDEMLTVIEGLKADLERVVKAPILDKIAEYMEGMKQLMNKREQMIIMKLQFENEMLKKKREEIYTMNDKVMQIAFSPQPNLITLNVGGKDYITSPQTLLSNNNNQQNRCPDQNNVISRAYYEMIRNDPSKTRIVIDRDPLHFELILNYMRDGKSSLVWLKDRNMSEVDMKKVQFEADYYQMNRLVRLISWELSIRKPPIELRGSTMRDTTFIEECFKNITGFQFKHRTSFKFCFLENITFTNCTFTEVVDFRGSNMSGVKFVNCRGYNTPKDVIYVDHEFEDVLPSRWAVPPFYN
jgi:hypothetical protein